MIKQKWTLKFINRNDLKDVKTAGEFNSKREALKAYNQLQADIEFIGFMECKEIESKYIVLVDWLK